MSSNLNFYDSGDASYGQVPAQQPGFYNPGAYAAAPQQQYAQVPPQQFAAPQQQYGYSGSIMNPHQQLSAQGFDDEPPLLEELGVNFQHIWQRTMFVLHPVEQEHSAFLSETDLAGPLLFCLLFGACLLASGKMHFGYIYGVAMIGCVGLWAILSLMSVAAVSLGRTASVLGYCLLPMVALAGISLIIDLSGVFGILLSIAGIAWCSYSAAKMFAAALGMGDQRLLIGYPCFLLYGVFALMTIF